MGVVAVRVVQVRQFGGPEVLLTTEVADPVAGPGQVVVDVAAADVLFVEAMIRRGRYQDFFPIRPPYVPGGAVAGEVLSVGAGVDSGWVGRRVAVRTGDRGGYAERALVAHEDLIPVPGVLSLPEAAALLHDGPTALAIADNARLTRGEQVLITAAAGGLGILLAQLASTAGARVVGAARGERKLAVLRELGTDEVVDYQAPDWAEQVLKATGGAGPEVVFDGAGGQLGRAAFDIIAGGGRFSAHGAAAGGFAAIDPVEAGRRKVTVRGIEQVQFAPADARRLAGRALAEAAAGRIRPVIGQTFPLAHAADAHAAVEARDVVGKTLLLT